MTIKKSSHTSRMHTRRSLETKRSTVFLLAWALATAAGVPEWCLAATAETKTTGSESKAATTETKATASEAASSGALTATPADPARDPLLAQPASQVPKGGWREEELRRQQTLKQARRSGNPAEEIAALLSLGKAMTAQQKHGEAERVYRQAGTMAERLYGKEDDRVAEAWAYLGSSLLLQKRFLQAEEYFLKTIAIQDKHHNMSDGWIVPVLYGTAMCKEGRMQFAESEHFLKRALLACYIGEPDDKVLFGITDKLAQCERTLGRYDESITLLQRALRLGEAASGSERRASDSQTRILTENLALSQEALGRYGEAEALIKRNLATGGDSISWNIQGRLRATLSRLYLKQGNFDDAAKQAEQALALGKDKPLTEQAWRLPCLWQYGAALWRNDHLEDAGRIFLQAVNESEQAGAKPSDLRKSLDWYARFLNLSGRTKEAQTWFDRATEARKADISIALADELKKVDLTYQNKVVEVAYCGKKEDSLFTSGFKTDIARALLMVPAEIRDQLNKAGYKIVLVPTMADFEPWKSSIRPRGYRHGSTRTDERALFNRDLKTVVIAEQKARSSGWHMSLPEAIQHELGHAIDDYLGEYSALPKYRQAYKEDVDSGDKSLASKLAYYLQPGDAGRHETFAQLFAITCPNRTSSAKDMKAQFPRTLELVRSAIASQFSRGTDIKR